MKIATIICEYNPLHRGHTLLFERIRERCGADTAILAVMSGNFVQRGEPAILSKWARARAATEAGADLVLELPFPYSSSSAERFARSGVEIADALGCVDYLAFGSECGDTERLMSIAKNMESDLFSKAYIEADEDKTIGSAQKNALAYERLFGREERLHSPNDILGIEYIRALLRKKSSITPIAFLREGAAHDAPEDTEISSAMTARRMLQNGEITALLSKLPAASAAVIQEEWDAKRTPASIEKYKDFLLLYYRLCNRQSIQLVDGLSGGLGDRILGEAQVAKNGRELFELIRTKRYTDAFLRRALLYGLFGVTRERLNTPPPYTQVLSFTERGREILALARRISAIPILTKPADYKQLTASAKEAAELSIRADSMYCGLFPSPSSPCDILRYTPYRKA